MEEKWEYTFVDTVISGWADENQQVQEFLAGINSMGAEGWEMTTESVIHTKGWNGTQYPVLFFKRRVS